MSQPENPSEDLFDKVANLVNRKDVSKKLFDLLTTKDGVSVATEDFEKSFQHFENSFQAGTWEDWLINSFEGGCIVHKSTYSMSINELDPEAQINWTVNDFATRLLSDYDFQMSNVKAVYDRWEIEHVPRRLVAHLFVVTSLTGLKYGELVPVNLFSNLGDDYLVGSYVHVFPSTEGRNVCRLEEFDSARVFMKKEREFVFRGVPRKSGMRTIRIFYPSN